MSGPRLFLIAGEPSGDRLGADLMAGLKALAPGVQFEGVGGPLMEAEGLISLFPMKELTVMGLAEVLPHIPRLLRRIRQTADRVFGSAPDALITIDAPDFSLRVAARARAERPGLKVIHYVAPSVWAWRPGRAARMARHVDHVLTLLPFEPPLREAAGMTAEFVGHPAAALPRPEEGEVAALREALGIGDRRVLAVLPGSRRGEVARLAPVFGAAAGRLAREEDLALVVPAASGVAAEVQAAVAAWPVPAVVIDPLSRPAVDAEAAKRAAFAMAEAALAASGTVSLELAAAGTPMVIAYRVNALSAAIARRLLKIDTVTLVNIVTGEKAIPEFLQEGCTEEALVGGLRPLLAEGPERAAQLAAMERAMTMLGRGAEPSGQRAARSVLGVLG
ncbi:MAG: lipid-A-disaccharide synthase [Pseudomonadota bacterium]